MLGKIALIDVTQGLHGNILNISYISWHGTHHRLLCIIYRQCVIGKLCELNDGSKPTTGWMCLCWAQFGDLKPCCRYCTVVIHTVLSHGDSACVSASMSIHALKGYQVKSLDIVHGRHCILMWLLRFYHCYQRLACAQSHHDQQQTQTMAVVCITVHKCVQLTDDTAQPTSTGSMCCACVTINPQQIGPMEFERRPTDWPADDDELPLTAVDSELYTQYTHTY